MPHCGLEALSKYFSTKQYQQLSASNTQTSTNYVLRYNRRINWGSRENLLTTKASLPALKVKSGEELQSGFLKVQRHSRRTWYSVTWRKKINVWSWCSHFFGRHEDSSTPCWNFRFPYWKETTWTFSYEWVKLLSNFFPSSLSTHFPPPRPSLPLISAPTGSLDWSLVTRWAQLLIT